MTNFSWRRRSWQAPVVVAALAVLALCPLRAGAETPKAGAILYVNRTAVAIEIAGRYTVDTDGDNITNSWHWKMKPGQQMYLATPANEKMVARVFAYTLLTADGSSDWVARATVLDEYGDFVVVLTEENLKAHQQTTRPKKAGGEDATARTARRTKEAWDAMGRVNGEIAPILNRNAVEFLEKFAAGYGQINTEDIDPELNDLIRDMTSTSAACHAAVLKYRRTRSALEQRRSNLGDCPPEPQPAYQWWQAFSPLTRQILDLDDQWTVISAANIRQAKEVEKRAGDLGQSLATKYPAYRFSR